MMDRQLTSDNLKSDSLTVRFALHRVGLYVMIESAIQEFTRTVNYDQ